MGLFSNDNSSTMGKWIGKDYYEVKRDYTYGSNGAALYKNGKPVQSSGSTPYIVDQYNKLR